MNKILTSKPVAALAVPVLLAILSYAGVISIEINTKDGNHASIEAVSDTGVIIAIDGDSQVLTIDSSDTQ